MFFKTSPLPFYDDARPAAPAGCACIIHGISLSGMKFAESSAIASSKRRNSKGPYPFASLRIAARRQSGYPAKRCEEHPFRTPAVRPRHESRHPHPCPRRGPRAFRALHAGRFRGPGAAGGSLRLLCRRRLAHGHRLPLAGRRRVQPPAFRGRLVRGPARDRGHGLLCRGARSAAASGGQRAGAGRVLHPSGRCARAAAPARARAQGPGTSAHRRDARVRSAAPPPVGRVHGPGRAAGQRARTLCPHAADAGRRRGRCAPAQRLGRRPSGGLSGAGLQHARLRQLYRGRPCAQPSRAPRRGRALCRHAGEGPRGGL